MSSLDVTNYHSKRLKSQRKDSARAFPIEPILEAKEMCRKEDLWKRKSCGDINNEDWVKPTPTQNPPQTSHHVGFINEEVEKGDLQDNSFNTKVSRRISSPQLIKQKKETEEEEEEQESDATTKLELAPKPKGKKRPLHQSISSRLPFGPIQHAAPSNKKKRGRKGSSAAETFRPVPRSKSTVTANDLGDNLQHTEENEADPFGSAPLFKVPKVVHSPKLSRAMSHSPRNVEIYARHSGLRASGNRESKHEISEQSKRFRIIQELRDTERTYVTGLHMVTVIFISPLRSQLNTSKQILSAKEIKSIFGNIEDVCHFSQTFLESLEVRIHPSAWTDESTIGDLFNQVMDESVISRVYSEYIDTYENALRIIKTAFHTENSPFGEFARARQVLCDNHSLSSLLVLPIQRIPRYQLLLEDLIKATPKQHNDYASLVMAHKKMVSLANLLNESKWREESQLKMKEISLKFKKCFHSDLNVKGRELLTQGEILQEAKRTSGSPAELETRTLFVFNDLLVCASSGKQSKHKVAWKAKLIYCHIQFSENEEDGTSKISISEMKLVPEEPYLIEHREELYPSGPPYDFSFWKSSLQNAMETFQWDRDRLLVDNSALIANHMKKYLIGERELTMLQIGAKKTSFLQGENICPTMEGGSDAVYFVNYGQISIEKYIGGEWITINILGSVQFFGEFSYLLGPEVIQKEYPVRYTVCTDAAIITKISFDQLDYLFHRNPALALNFYKLLTFKYAQLYIFQTYTLSTNSSKSYMYFIQRLNRFLHQKDPTKSSLSDHSNDGSEKQTKALLSKLKLAPTEVILANYPCKLKRDLRSGILVIFTDFIIIAYSIFGHISNQTRILHENIANFQLQTNQCLELILVNEQTITLQFGSSQHVSEVLQLLSVLVEQNQLKIEKQLSPTREFDCLEESMILSSQDWEIVNTFSEIIELEEGETIIVQDSRCCGLYRVRSGLFDISRRVASQNSNLNEKEEGANVVSITTKIVGQFFGEVSFIFGGVTTSNITATSPASCWKFSQENIEKLILHHPILAAKLFRALACDLLQSVLKQQKTFEGFD